MKTIFLLALIGLNYSLSAQGCFADFSYTIGNNNIVTFTDSSSCSPGNGYQTYDFGDYGSGRLNTSSPFNRNERKHFYKNPGVYMVCTYLTQGGSCSCNDMTCKQITITGTGSNCNAKYCYSATDTNGYLEAILINTSGSDDPITNVYWDFNDGSQSTAYHVGHSYNIVVADQLTYLYVQSQSGCQSVVFDTIKPGTNCSSTPAGIPGQALSLLEGCWRWDYYGGGIAGLPPTVAWKDVRIQFSRDAQDSVNGTISFRTYADTLAVDSGRASVWIDSNYLSWFVMDDVLALAFGFSSPPFPPIYFQDNHGAIEFTHFDISDDFYYGFVSDTCAADTTVIPQDTTAAKIDSMIALLKGCWRYDFYGGGFAGLPPTPTAGTISLRLDQDAQDSLNQTVSFWNYVNGILADSGRATLSLTQPGLSYYSFVPDIISNYTFIYFEHYNDTMVFTHLFPDEFYYGYVKESCTEITTPADTTAVIDSIINILNGCWRWDFYFGGRMGLPPTPATENIRLAFSQDAQDSLNHTVTGQSYLNDTLEFSGTCEVAVDSIMPGFYRLSCGLFDSLGIVGSPPLYFYIENDTILFPQQQFLDGFVYGFLSDSCVADTTSDTTTIIDSIINVLDGCWQWDHYFGGFAGIPPTPAWADVRIEFSQTTQDSLNHTVTGESYLNDTLEFSGTCNVVADTINRGYYTLSCGLFDSIGIVGWPPLIFNFEGDTLLFPQQQFVDGYVYGFLKGCEDDTIINGTEFPENIQVRIYPNPASDKIVIELENDQPVKIIMYDLVGKRLKELRDVQSKIEVNVSAIPTGVYFITIETEKGLLSRKLVISR